MGTVYAKEQVARKVKRLNLPADEGSDEECRTEKKQINLEGIEARVDKINVDGLRRTKDDIVLDTVRELFKANDFQQVIVGAHKVRSKLDALGCFRNIGIYIDVSTGPQATPRGLEVTFHVRELKRLVGGVNTMVGNNEGSLVVGLRAPNLFGRGEKLQSEYTYGSKKTTGINITFSKPLRGSCSPVFTSTIFQHGSEWPASAYKQIDRGILLDFALNYSPTVRQSLQWEGIYRDLSCLTRTAAFAVREQSGPSLKSALRHVLHVDGRDSAIFPSSGVLLRVTNELAGIGGNIGFLKNEVEMQHNLTLMSGVVLQAGLQGGILTRLEGDKTVSICDRFFLGGPLNLRGFEARGAGPHADGNAVGADVYLAGALHLYTPLPFNPGKGGLGELFRLHFFLNGGNIGNFNFFEDFNEAWNELSTGVRAAYGLGLALRLGQMARVELNYCVPFSTVCGDRSSSGVQLGIGVHFL